MLTLMMFALCLCLAFQGVEILQIGLVSAGPFRKYAMRLGIFSAVFALVAATVLAAMFMGKVWEFDQMLRQLSAPPPAIRPQGYN